MKCIKIIAWCVSVLFVISLFAIFAYADESVAVVELEDIMPFDIDANSAILMDAASGTVLYSKNANEAYPPASVTKIMTILLIMEAIDGGSLSFDESISVSEYAASMGGSQVYLKAGETMTVRDLLKSVVIASANDAALALAERIGGSELAFVAKMNERAAELGMNNTKFENVTGLDDDTQDHVTSAYDIALMSRELLKHDKIFEFTTTWMDTIRDGEFGLTNTNRLIRFYKGATGLKTGSTARAKFCISATAERDGLHLIAVIMGSPTRDIRNEAAKSLLDWGFANYGIYKHAGGEAGTLTVRGGVLSEIGLSSDGIELLVKKSELSKVRCDTVLPESLSAPIAQGDKVGEIVYYLGDAEIGRSDIKAAEASAKLGYIGVLLRMLDKILLK